MSRSLGPTKRFLLAALATTVALGPGLASIVDAKPAARSLTQRLAPHAEETGRQHDLRAHVDDCMLCRLATRDASERRKTTVPMLAVAPAPLGDQQIPLPHSPEERWSALSRAPPPA